MDLNYLHSQGKRGIKRFAARLGIEFRDSMLTTTFLGKIWWGNSASGELSNGLDVKKAELNWPSLMLEKDQILISTTLKVPISLFGYEMGTIDETVKLKDPRQSLICLNLQIKSITQAFWETQSISKNTSSVLTLIRVFVVWLSRNVFSQDPLGAANFSDHEQFRKLVGNLKKDHFLH